MQATENSTFIAAVKAAGFVVDIYAEQDDCEVRGNATASGDDAYDKRVEDEIIRRLDNGDVWAWASVTVSISHPAWPGIIGTDHLGCCCYADEADFAVPDGYYPDMIHEALTDWRDRAAETNPDEAQRALSAADDLLA